MWFHWCIISLIDSHTLPFYLPSKHFPYLQRELVYYYYIWKKTPTAINSRPHKRGRRHSVLCRKTRSTKSKSSAASEFVDLSSCSEDEPDSEDSERDLSLYACRHCFSAKSRNWHHVGKDKLLVCEECRIYFKKYGRMKPIESRADPPSFIFKAAFENHNENLPYSGRMRTRRSATPIYTINGSVRSKILQEMQEGWFLDLFILIFVLGGV